MGLNKHIDTQWQAGYRLLAVSPRSAFCFSCLHAGAPVSLVCVPRPVSPGAGTWPGSVSSREALVSAGSQGSLHRAACGECVVAPSIPSYQETQLALPQRSAAPSRSGFSTR